MTIYYYPALIALLINIAVIWIALKGERKTKWFIPLLVLCSLLNLVELLSTLESFGVGGLATIVRIYYACAIALLSLVCLYAAEVAKHLNTWMTYSIFLVAIMFAVAVLSTDLVVAGAYRVGYAITAVQGEAYIAFQVIVLLMLALIGFVLLSGYRNASSHQQQIKCAGTLLALLPTVVASIVILVLMFLGFKITALGILPITMVAFILITLASEEALKLTDIRRFIPGSAERRTSREVMEICTHYSRDEVSYRETINEIERVLVNHKYKKNNKNAATTAELMGLPRSSLYSMFNRLKIGSKSN